MCPHTSNDPANVEWTSQADRNGGDTPVIGALHDVYNTLGYGFLEHGQHFGLRGSSAGVQREARHRRACTRLVQVKNRRSLVLADTSESENSRAGITRRLTPRVDPLRSV
jgi:hypothetical protein